MNNWSYTSCGAFSGEACFITERHGQQVARAKVKAGVIPDSDWLVTKLKLLSFTGCLDTGPYGREHQKAVARDLLRAFIKRTIRLNGLRGYLGYEMRSHFVYVFLSDPEFVVEWTLPDVRLYGMELPITETNDDIGLFDVPWKYNSW